MSQQEIDQDQRIHDEGDLRKWYSQIVHMADDDLDMKEYRLYGHYMRVCGQRGGICNETERTTYTKCQMSRNTFVAARKRLIDKGFIRIVEEGSPNQRGIKGTPTVIACNDLWAKNYVRYARPDQIMEMSDLRGQGNTSNENPSVCEDDGEGDDLQRKGDGLQHRGDDLQPNASNGNPKKNEELKKESKKTRLPGAEAAGVATSLNADDEKQFKAKGGHDKYKSNHVITMDALNEHPLVQLLCEKTSLYLLTDAMVKDLTEPITTFQSDGTTITYRGGLINFWDTMLGFESFARQRIAEMANMKEPMTHANMLKHLRNVDKEGRLKGFFAWKKLHPELCTLITHAEKVVEIGPVPKWDGPVWSD
jgi:hypothetical protein